MLTPEQIAEIRAGAGLSPAPGFSNSLLVDKNKVAAGKYDYLKEKNDKKYGVLDYLPAFLNPSKQKQYTEEAATTLADSLGKRVDRIKSIYDRTAPIQGGGNENQTQGAARSGLQLVGEVTGGVGDLIFEGLKFAAKKLTPEVVQDYLGAKAQQAIEQPKIREGLMYLSKGVEKYNEWEEANPQTAADLRGLLGVVDIVTTIVGAGPIAKGVEGAALKAAEATGSAGNKALLAIARGGSELASAVPDMSAASGLLQTGKDFLGRIPRVAQRIGEGLETASVRAAKIKESSPAAKRAMESNLDERIINTVIEADEPTVGAYRQVLDLADNPPKTIGAITQPSKISGDLAVKQFSFISKEKKRVGSAIGDLIKGLSKTEKIDMMDSFLEVRKVLSDQGIEVGAKGKLKFKVTNLKPSERSAIQQLFDMASEGGKNLSPLDIKKKDQLFSKLQREARMADVGEIIIETPEGSKSIFSVFRDIFSKKLDDISPEVKALNKQYRDLVLITDDIEDSIFRTPNFNVTKSADGAEFAKVNLRRIFGEAQSSPVFEAVADKMDELARQLGYADATPKQVAAFAQELRKLYPDTIPKTGFSGGIRAGIPELIEYVSKAGVPNAIDQRKALRELLDELFPKAEAVVPQTTPQSLKTAPGEAIAPKAGNLTAVEAKASGLSFDEWVKGQGETLYHGGENLKEVGNMRSKWGAFYMTENPTYAKSYGGKSSTLNEISLSKNAKIADLRKPSRDLIKQIDEIISPKETGKTIIITKPDGTKLTISEKTGGLSNPVHSSTDIIQGIKDGKAYFAEMPEVKKALKKLGYDGMITQESKFGANYGVWNKNVIKTRSQLKAEWDKVK